MSKDLIDAFLADPQNAELRAQWESQYPDPRDKVFIRHLAYRKATGFDKLVAILNRELEITQEVIARSPILFESGKPATIQIVNTNAFPQQEHETSAQWIARTDAEAKRLGVRWTELMVEANNVTVKYWELQTSKRYVYIEDQRICAFFGRDKAQLYEVTPEGMSIKNIEELIQGLRLLCTSFNGAVVDPS